MRIFSHTKPHFDDEKKLPIGPTVREIYRRLLEDFGYATRIAGIWITVGLVLPQSTIAVAGGGDSLKVLSISIFAAGWPALAVLWHHRQLCRNAPRLSIKDWVFRTGGYGWELFTICGLAGLVYGPALMIGAFAGVSLEQFLDSSDVRKGDDDIIVRTVLATMVLAVASTFSYLCLVLPAVALDVPDFGKWASWQYMRGNSLRLLSAWVLAAMPSMSLAILCLEIARAFSDQVHAADR